MRSLVTAAAVAVLATSLAAGAEAATTCGYSYTDPTTNSVWTWDMSSLSTTGGYYVNDATTWNGVHYNSNIFNINLCAPAPTECIPQGYVPVARNGVAVETWGAPPECTVDSKGKYCRQSPTVTVRDECCTANCTVLSTSTDAVSFPINPSLLGKGTGDGLVLQFPVLQDPNSDRSICEDGTPTMAAQYSIYCDAAEEFSVQEVENQGCEFNFVIKSKYGCASLQAATTTTTPAASVGMSPGSAFLLILFIAVVLYFGVGTVILRAMTGTWTIPNRPAWVALGGLIGDGVGFIRGGCRKRPAAYVDSTDPGGGGGDDDGDYHEAGKSPFGAKATTSGADEPYDDL